MSGAKRTSEPTRAQKPAKKFTVVLRYWVEECTCFSYYVAHVRTTQGVLIVGALGVAEILRQFPDAGPERDVEVCAIFSGHQNDLKFAPIRLKK